MGDLNDLLIKLDSLAKKAASVEAPGGSSPEEIAKKLMLPRKPLKPSMIKLHPTKEEAIRRAEDKEYDEAMEDAEDTAEQIKKWLVE